MRRQSVIFATLAVGLACATGGPELSVHTHHPEGASFGELRSFRIASRPPSDPDARSYERLERLTREVLREQLAARGFVAIDDGPPDFRVVWDLSFRSPEGRPPREDASFADPAPSGPESAQPDGTLLVRMVDPVTLQVLWEGTVSGFHVGPIQPKEDLRRAAWRLLAEFPPIVASPSG